MVAGRTPPERPISSHGALTVSLWVMRSGWVVLHVALLFHIISISTPYWIVSTTHDYHDGIWPNVVDPVCAHMFYPGHLTGEPRQLAKTAIAADVDSQCGSSDGSYYVRDPMDDWIKGVQAPMVLGTIFLLLAVVVINYRAFAADSYITIALIFITICSAFTSGSFTFIAICVFGLRYRSLLQLHNYNLSWSYAFAVVPCIFALFSSLLLVAEMHVQAVIIPLNKKKNQLMMEQSTASRDQSQESTETSMDIFSRKAAKDPFCVASESKVQGRKPVEGSALSTEERPELNTSEHQLNTGASVKRGGPRLGPLLSLRHQMQNKNENDDSFCVQSKPTRYENTSDRNHKRSSDADDCGSQMMSVTGDSMEYIHSDNSHPVVAPKRRSKQKRRKETARTEEKDLQLVPSREGNIPAKHTRPRAILQGSPDPHFTKQALATGGHPDQDFKHYPSAQCTWYYIIAEMTLPACDKHP